MTQDVVMIDSEEAFRVRYGSINQAESLPQGENSMQPLSPLLALPAETRFQILGYLLATSQNHKRHYRSNMSTRHFKTRVEELQQKPILELRGFAEQATPFDNGRSVRTSTCDLDPKVLGTCKQLRAEGRMVLYGMNRYLAVVTSFAHFGSMIRNFGIQSLWGPFQHPPRFVADGILHRIDFSAETAFRPVVTTAIRCRQNARTYLFCVEDETEVQRFLWLYVWEHGLSAPPHTLLSVHLRSDLHIPGLCNNGNALKILLKKRILPWLGSGIGSAVCGDSTAAADVDRNVELRSLVQTYRPIPPSWSYEAVRNSLEGMKRDAKEALITGKLSMAEEIYEMLLFQAADVIREEHWSVLAVIAEWSETEANQMVVLAGVAAYHLALLRANHETTTTKDRPYSAMRSILEGTLALQLPSLVALEERKARLHLAMCGSYAELAMWSEAWDHARKAMEALVPYGQSEEQKAWIEKSLNELDAAETTHFIRTELNFLNEGDVMRKRVQGRKDIFAKFVEHHQVNIELKWGTWLQADGEEWFGDLVDFLGE